MPPTTVKLRCDSEQLQHWKESAEKGGEDFSKWARRILDETANGQHVYLKSEERSSHVRPVGIARRGISDAVVDRDSERIPKRQSPQVAKSVAEDLGFDLDAQAAAGQTGKLTFETPVVRHTASSNWLTCLCPTCIDKRKKNDIPLGGMPPKKKGWKR
jgi:hypothetical protein